MKYALAAAALVVALPAAAQSAADPQLASAEIYVAAPTDAPDPGGESAIQNYFDNWFNRVAAAQASQPHWMTPLVTVTPRLEEEVRYDQYVEHTPAGSTVDVFDAGKGLELIPDLTNEILINAPPYQERTVTKAASGLADYPFLVVKQRLLSANEENGNYIVTAFLGVQAPAGIKAFTNDAWVITPTLAGGKGWGDFDVQATLGVPIPLERESTIGTALAGNAAFQYHFAKYFWPEVEVNWTHWLDGERGGLNQVFLTPGLILGRFQIYQRLKLIVGAGYQIAVAPEARREPLTPLYQNAFVGTVRVAF